MKRFHIGVAIWATLPSACCYGWLFAGKHGTHLKLRVIHVCYVFFQLNLQTSDEKHDIFGWCIIIET
jgi:hypothetical protein